MKKNIFFLFLLSSITILVNAQTYVYKHTYSVNSYGEKERGSGRIVYYTFGNDFRTCMRSNEHGERKGEGREHSASYEFNTSSNYYFEKTTNNVHIYYGTAVREIRKKTNSPNSYRQQLEQLRDAVTANHSYETYKRNGVVLKFSNDFSKLNIVPYSSDSNKDILVYERCKSIEEGSDNNTEFYE